MGFAKNSFEAAINNKLDYVIRALDDFNSNNLQEKNRKLKKSLETLTHKHNNLICVALDLNARIQDLENECSKLLTAVELKSYNRKLRGGRGIQHILLIQTLQTL